VKNDNNEEMHSNDSQPGNEEKQRQQQLFEDSDVKHASDIIGDWGPVQSKVFIFFVCIYTVGPFQNLSLVFFAPKLDFYCLDSHHNTSLKNTCHFLVNDTLIKCSKFSYNMSLSGVTYHQTLTETFDLVCDRSWYPSMTQTIHQVGYAISGVAFGFISDRYGRVFSAKLAIGLEVITGFIQAFSPTMTSYMVSRLFFGAASYGRFLNGYVLIMEWVGPKLRGDTAVYQEFGYSVGYILLPIVFQRIADYRIIQTSVAFFELMMLCLLMFIIPESPRWLLNHCKFKEAHESISTAAKKKGLFDQEDIDKKFTSLKNNTIKELEEQKQQKKSTILHVWKIPRLRNLSFILYFTWFSHSFIYYGSVFNISNMGGDIFTNFIVFGVSYTVSNGLLLFLLNKFGRRPLLIFMTFLESFAFLGMFFTSFFDVEVERHWWYIRVFFAFLAVIGVSCGFNLIYIYTTETFPTTMRQVSIGSCSIFARVGSGVAPFMKELTNVTHLSVSMTIFGLLAFLNALLVLHVPETKGKQLPDTLLQTAANCENEELLKTDSSTLAVVYRVTQTADDKENFIAS
jgi:OCT family organic cation transporter-like MFS transporter 4/5